MSGEPSGHQFSSDTLSVQCIFRPGCVIELTVTTKPETTMAAYHKAVKEIRKEISLPGFRKGHVPEEMVHKHFEFRVERQMQGIVAQAAFEEACALVGRQPFAKNSLRKSAIRSCSKETGAEILFEYEASPQVPVVDINDMNLEAISAKLPSESDVEEFYTRLRYIYCEKRPIENRPIADGDAVKVEISHTAEASPASYDFHVRQGLIPEWLHPAIIGMNIGESKEVLLPPPSSKTPASSCTVKIVQIFECLLPEENDTFAQTVGAKSIDELRQSIRLRLEYDAKNLVQEKMRRQVRNELIRLYAFDLPQSLVEGETEVRFRPYWELVAKSGKTAPDKETLRKTFLEEVKRQFTCFFLLQPFFSKIKPSYTHAELMDELNYQTSKAHVTQCVLHPGLKEEEIFDRLLSNIIMRQCEDYCIEQRLGISPPVLARAQAHQNLEEVEAHSCHGEECSCHEDAPFCDCH